MFRRFFLQLFVKVWRSENRNQFEHNSLYGVAGAWLLLNACLWVIPEQTSWWLVAALNGWFVLLLVLAYDYGRKWLSLLLKDVRSTEQWARYYLKDLKTTGDKRKKVPFNQGNWVVTDAILAMNDQFEQAVTQSYQVDQFVRAQTFLDSETGVGNRLYFDHRVEAFLADKETDNSGCVFLIQLKELDVIQLEAGEDEAKELLSYFIELISHYLKNHPNAVFARRAEFDFAILIPFINSSETQTIATQLIRLCNRISLPDCVVSEHFFHIGVASCQTNETLYQLLSEADMALRAAQLQGPSNWFMYEQGTVIKDLAKGSVKWRTALEAAIDHQAFMMLLQPVMLTDNSEIHHHEILARMRIDNGQLASAAVFLPMAQKCGLVAKIDQLVVEKTLKLLQYEKSGQDICSLNLHIDSLLDNQFSQWVVEFLQRFPNVACRMIIEVSEYQLVHQGQSLKPLFRQLHKTGVRLLVDQVGLYVLNTQYIREFEIDYLKLHVSIVKNIDLRPENQLFVKSLQAACSGTHVLIFGLGVERVGEWIALQKLGVAGAQGHYFTEPLESINQISPSH